MLVVEVVCIPVRLYKGRVFYNPVKGAWRCLVPGAWRWGEPPCLCGTSLEFMQELLLIQLSNHFLTLFLLPFLQRPTGSISIRVQHADNIT
jgi:hypothetical protein